MTTLFKHSNKNAIKVYPIHPQTSFSTYYVLKNIEASMKKRLSAILLILTSVNFYLYNPSSDRVTSNKIFDEFKNDPDFSQIDQFTFSFKKYYMRNIFRGRSFDKKWNPFLVDLDLFNITDVDDETILRSSPVVVTAFSSNHFENGIQFLDSFRKFYDFKIVYVYDIGLNDNETDEIRKRYDNIVVEIRPFLFDKYPKYVSNMHEYRWKSLIIASMLKEFPSIWWIDSSVRLKKSLTTLEKNFTRLCSTKQIEVQCRKFPWIFVDSTSSTVNPRSVRNIYDFLPVPENLSTVSTTYVSQMQLIFATNEIRRNVLRYSTLCALEKDCMTSVKTNLFCYFLYDRNNFHDICQRYDHFIVNILLSWSVKFNRQTIITISEDKFQPE